MSAAAAEEARKRNNAQKQQIAYWRKQANLWKTRHEEVKARLDAIIENDPDAETAPPALPGEEGGAAAAAAKEPTQEQLDTVDFPDPRKIDTVDDLIEHEKFALERIYVVQAQARRQKRPGDELKAIQEVLKMANRIAAKLEKRQKEADSDEVLAVALPNRGEPDFSAWCRRNGIRMSSGEPVPATCGTCNGTGVEPAVHAKVRGRNTRAVR